MKKKTLLFISILLFQLKLFSQTNCSQINFQKIISGAGDNQANDVIYTSDNGFLICGSTTSAGAGDYDALIIKLDFNGNILWSKTYGSSGNDGFRRVIATKDGNYLAVGWSQFDLSHIADVFIVKFDPAGNLIWGKSFGAGTPNGERGLGIIETTDGGFVIAGDYNSTPSIVQPLYLKVDANGNLIWVDLMNVANAGEAFGIVEDGNYLTATGVVATNGLSTFNDGYIAKLQSNDGSLVWLKNVESESRSNRLNDIRLKNGQYIFDMYNSDSWVSVNEKPLIFTTDTSGTLLYSKSYEVTGINTDMIYESIYPTADNGYIASLSETINNSSPRLIKINASGAVDWVNNFTPYYSQHLTRVIQDPANEFVSVGFVNTSLGSNGNILFIKTDANGNIKDTTGNAVCPVTHSSALNNDIPIQITNANYFNITDGGIQNVLSNVAVNNFTPQVQNPCAGHTDKCDTLKITGSDSVCSLKDVITYKAFKNAACLTPVQWSIDNTFATVISSTDSTVQLQFKKNGTAFLNAKMISCNVLQDSILITALHSPDALALGPDISLCENNDSLITLNAGGGFKSYLWQDGSTDSVFKTRLQGKYFVTAENYCGKQFSDTLLVNLAPPVPFSLGPDLHKCNNDTLTITAPAGFTNYLWSPKYAINNPDSQTVQIFSSHDTAYICSAQHGIGCTVSDTINVNIFQPSVVNIGNDTSFCVGDSLNLNAGSGFVSYLWNTGSVEQQITVKQKGVYFVKVIDANNCSAKDTLVIQNVFNLPAISIGPDTFVCKNSVYVFNAGNNFINYLWQDGSTGATFAASQPGIYSVQVTDINHCSNADTAKILAIANLPENFLADTASICAGYLLQLNAIGNWPSYKWFDSTTASFTTITSPGVYWLQVTNSSGCSAIDSIDVTGKDDCTLGIYFPNAFTPNHDGRNDTFRPIIYGYLDKFHMVIFNRWGQKIFETSDAAKGWDGTFQGEKQNSDTFVWYAEYHLAGSAGKEKAAKGTVTLIR
ncbi:MAG TPA: gliding motility-associated C-terminal domain-containing protein [Puia sp.]|nr:gliding motility-associated C-terminal domain-containing protein [Puia sp.]